MLKYKIPAFCCGILFSFLLPVIPLWYWWLVLLLVFTLGSYAWRPLFYISLFMLGMLFAIWRTEMVLSSQLPVEQSSTKATLTIEVVGIEQQPFNTRIFANIIHTDLNIHKAVLYDYQKQAWPIGSHWQIESKLKPPIGMVNIAGFNQEAWALSNHIDAIGSVGMDRVELPSSTAIKVRWGRFRYALQQRINNITADYPQGKALTQALALGMKESFSSENWQTFRALGLNHLVSISGLHVGLVAFFAALLLLYCFRIALYFGLKPPHTPKIYCLLFGLVIAWFYAFLAGFSVPTQRSVVMISVLVLGICVRQYYSYWQIWWAAVLLVLLYDPLSALSVGFWLSFLLVGTLLLYGARIDTSGHKVWAFIKIQLSLTIISTVLVAYLFVDVPILSPVVNLIAIPWFTFILVPLCLLAILLPIDALLLFTVALMDKTMVVLQMLAELAPIFAVAQSSLLLFVLALIAAVVMIIPGGSGLRTWAMTVLLIFIFWPKEQIKSNSAKITIIDVGQGSSLLIETANHNLLFDTGKPPAPMRVLPTLKSLGIRKLDVLVLSHPDLDHDGGVNEISKTFQPQLIWAGYPKKYQHLAKHVKHCLYPQNWAWDGVFFEWLNTKVPNSRKKNDLSCVLHMVVGNQAFLVTGDLPSDKEEILVGSYGDQLYSPVLVLGHHGSHTSTSVNFLNAVAPAVTIASAGFANQYKHPSSQVINRLQEYQIPLWRTDLQGALQLSIDENHFSIKQVKQLKPYWQRKPFMKMADINSD